MNNYRIYQLFSNLKGWSASVTDWAVLAADSVAHLAALAADSVAHLAALAGWQLTVLLTWQLWQAWQLTVLLTWQLWQAWQPLGRGRQRPGSRSLPLWAAPPSPPGASRAATACAPSAARTGRGGPSRSPTLRLTKPIRGFVISKILTGQYECQELISTAGTLILSIFFTFWNKTE